MKPKLYWLCFIFPSWALISVGPAYSQILPTQVVTLTVGNRGSVQTNQTIKEKDDDQFFSFSLATEDKRLRSNNQKKKKLSQTDTQYDFDIRTGAYILESGTKKEVTKITTIDTFDYIDSTFNQSVSIDY